MIKTLTVTNPSGDVLVLDMKNPLLSGFKITSITGLGPTKASINTTDFGSGDGSVFNSARVGMRNIVLTLVLIENPTIETMRQLSYKFFPVKQRIALVVETDNRIVQTYGYVEANDPDIFSSQESIQVSILCEDPYFYSVVTQLTNKIRNNLVSNPSSETDIIGWSSSSGGSTTVVISRQTSGGYSGISFFRSVYSPVSLTDSTNGLNYSRVGAACKPNATYTMSIYVRTNRDLSVTPRAYTISLIGGTVNLTPTLGPSVLCLANVWTRVSITVVSDYNAEQIDFDIMYMNASSAFTVDLDAAMIEESSVLGSYVEGRNNEFGVIRKNIITNPSFETDLTGWTAYAGIGGTVSAIKTVAASPFGLSFMRLTWSVPPSAMGGPSTTSIACTVGKTYTASIYVRSPVNITMLGYYTWFNGATQTITGFVGSPVFCPANVWTRVSVTSTCPVGSNNVQWSWNIVNGGVRTSGQILDVDGALMEESPSVGIYVEGTVIQFTYAGDDPIGALFKIHAVGSATNVSLTNVYTGEIFSLDTTKWSNIAGVSTSPTFINNDDFVISTVKGSKSLTLIRNGVSYNMINTFKKDSTWLQLSKGTNLFLLKADTGLDNLYFTVENQVIYEGV